MMLLIFWTFCIVQTVEGKPPSFLLAQPPILHSHFLGLYPRFGDRSTQKPYFTTTSIDYKLEQLFNVMSKNESPSKDSSSDDDRVISGLSMGRVLGASTNPYAINYLNKEFHKTPCIPPPIQRPPSHPPQTARTRGNWVNRRETSTRIRSSSRSRQGEELFLVLPLLMTREVCQ